MPRYFFNLRHRIGSEGLAVDEEGDVLAELNAAREHALFVARDTIVRTRTDIARDWTVCSYEVIDEHGQLIMTAPFSDCVRRGKRWVRKLEFQQSFPEIMIRLEVITSR